MHNNISIKVDKISKIYNLYDNPKDRLKEIFLPGNAILHKEYKALNDISFEVQKGETFGIIGTNGSGKSTLLKLITGVASPSEGTIYSDGRISALLELGAGFNRNYTGRENIYLNGSMMGYSREEMLEREKNIITFADIGEFINQPVKTYSSGMFARLAFAVAINVEPEILIVDEALSVGDVFFQNKCYKKFEELRDKGTTVLFVSHDIGAIKQLCSRVLWIEQGVQMMVGDSNEVCTAYTNSILEKRGKNAEKDPVNVTMDSYEINHFDLDNYPAINYTSESILHDKVKIISCFLTDTTGDRISVCKVNEKYKLSVIFDSKIHIEECIVGFVLETIKGLWIINCNSAMCGDQKIFQVHSNTYNRVDFIFDMPNLSNGDYVIGIAVSEKLGMDFKVLTWLYNVLYVQISDGKDLSGIINIEPQIEIFSDKKEIDNV